MPAHQDPAPRRHTRAVPGTPGWLRSTNDRTALGLLLENGPLTRHRIGELSGLSKPTASQMVSRLEAAGLIHEVGEISGGRGPNAASYAVRTENTLGVAVDIEAGTMLSTVVDAVGTEHPTATVALAKAARQRSAPSDVQQAIAAATDAAGVSAASIQFACIGVQGAVDPRTDDLSFADTLPGWPRKGVRRLLERELAIDIAIDNDVNLAAAAERTSGSGIDTDDFALLWMGDGLGLAVDRGGAVHTGMAGGAGEIGYLPTTRAAAVLDPTANDLQDLIGGSTITRLARECGIRTRSYRALVAATETGAIEHAAVESLLARLAPRVAIGVIPVLALLDPQRVVLGGPTGRLGGHRLAELVTAEVRRTSRWSPDVVASTVADHPVLRGARERLLTTIQAHLFDQVDRITTAP